MAIAPADFPAGTVAVRINIFGNYNTIGTIEFTDLAFGERDKLVVAALGQGGAHEAHFDGANVWTINITNDSVSKFDEVDPGVVEVQWRSSASFVP